MSIRIFRQLIIVLGLLVFIPIGVAADADKRLKAAMMIQLPKFISWPEHNQNKLGICVLGRNPFGQYLDDFANQQTQFQFDVHYLANVQDVKQQCQLVFIDESKMPSLEFIVSELNKQSILTVSDIESFADYGGMLHLYIQNAKLSLFVNIDKVKKSDIKISSHLLRFSKKPE